MIIRIDPDAVRLALRVKAGPSFQAASWRGLQLLVTPGPRPDECGGGSPMYFLGCWPGPSQTGPGIDVANFRPDFPAIVIDAFELDAEGRVVFRIKDAFRGLPPGRYHGELRFCPPMEPMCLTPLRDLGKPKTDEVRLPEGYEFALNQCGDPFPDPPPPPPPPARCCVVASFGIDLAPSCGDHYVDQIAALIPEGCMEDE